MGGWAGGGAFLRLPKCMECVRRCGLLSTTERLWDVLGRVVHQQRRALVRSPAKTAAADSLLCCSRPGITLS